MTSLIGTYERDLSMDHYNYFESIDSNCVIQGLLDCVTICLSLIIDERREKPNKEQ
jgi:hypothetical protein